MKRIHEELKEDIMKAIRAFDIVGATLGPRGRNILLDQGFGAPVATKDGVTVAREVELDRKEDPAAYMVSELLKEAASKTNDNVGDGTTTATVLAQALISAGLEVLPEDVHRLREGMEAAKDKVVAALKELATPVEDNLLHVATISANNDPETGKLVAEIVQDVGAEGVVSVEEHPGVGVETEKVEGMQFDRGFLAPYFITHPETMTAEYEEVRVLLSQEPIRNIPEIQPIVKKLIEGGDKRLVIIAPDVTGDALPTLVVNKLKGTFATLAIKAPGFGDNQKDMLADLAAMTGAKLFNKDAGMTFENLTMEDLGTIKKVVTDKDSTLIIGSDSQKQAVEQRVATIKNELENCDSDYLKERLMERIGKLTGGVAVVKVGAKTEAEMKEKRFLIDDALNATKAALRGGTVPGGGTALLTAQRSIENPEDQDASFDAGFKLVMDSLGAPLKRIVKNAGKTEDGLMDKIGEGKVYDAKQDLFLTEEDAKHIIDPVEVTISALENAVSVAGVLLTTSGAISEVPREQTVQAGMPMR